MHIVEVVEPLEVGPHRPIRHSDTVCDLLVRPALSDQIDDRDLCPRQFMDPARRSMLRAEASCRRELFAPTSHCPSRSWTKRAPNSLLVADYRIVLLISELGNCTFGQMAENPARRQPSPRQREVLDLLVRGMTNMEIGTRLGISERGVKYHVSQLLAIYRVENRAGLIVIVLGRKG